MIFALTGASPHATLSVPAVSIQSNETMTSHSRSSLPSGKVAGGAACSG